MWVICFYLNANKNALSEAVIGGCGRGGEREKEEMSFLPPCPPFSAACCCHCQTSASGASGIPLPISVS